MVSVIVIDSRSKIHPDWVEYCKKTILEQTVPVELIVIENTKRDKTIGKCWNEGVKQATGEWCFFVGDDCFLARDCVQVMLNHTDHKQPCVTTFMTMFDMKDKIWKTVHRPCTGMWRKEYLLKHPFNESLKKGIDREYLEEAKKRNEYAFVVDYYFGHYDRRHDEHRSATVKLKYPDEKQDIYITSSGGGSFISPLAVHWKNQGKKVILDTKPFDARVKSDIIWCEWANENAYNVSLLKTDAKRILRLHAYEAYSEWIFKIKWSAFDKVIFIAEHIKHRVEAVAGKIPNAVVIPVGIEIDKFTQRKKTERNNKVVWAGLITRKKGAGELMLIAKSLPDYEFHVIGKYMEDDVADYFNFQKPDNVFIHPYSYDLNKTLQDYTYYLNTSMREGNPITVLEAMACGLKPLVRDWIGSKIYNGYVYRNIQEIESSLKGAYHPEEYRSFAEKYDIKNTIKEIENVISN